MSIDEGVGAPGRQVRLDAPAQQWTDALPVGNGRLGAMVFGSAGRERIQVNDESCWTGVPGRVDIAPLAGPDGAPARVAAARAALAAGDVAAAEDHVRAVQSGNPEAYQPLVDLVLEHPGEGAAQYERMLDLRDGVAHHEWAHDGVTHEQDVLASHPDDVLVVERRSSVPVDLVVRLTSPHPWLAAPAAAADASHPADAGDSVLAVVQMPTHSTPSWPPGSTQPVRYEGAGVLAAVGMSVVSDGDVLATDGGVHVTGATRTVVLLTTATDHTRGTTALHGDADVLRDAVLATLRAARVDDAHDAGRLADHLRARHVADHRSLMDRVALDLGASRPGTTQDRLEAVARGADDPDLAALAFDVGRYLLVASSRPGGLPSNLQGIWNERLDPPWHANYTLNINTEMNYWPALVTGLAECHEPLLAFLPVLARRGATAARELYGLPGWTAHHNSDPWGFCLPTGDGYEEPAWSFWPMAGAWLSQHVGDHVDVTGDTSVLEDGWPVLVEAARFVLAWLVERDDGTLGTSPSTSPENTYLLPDGTRAALSETSTADVAIIRGLLAQVRDLAPVAAREGYARSGDDEVVATALAALDRLPAERVAPDGRLAEWSTDVPDAEPGHRHQSHLYGVFPGTTIDPDTAPELAAAAARTLVERGPHSTGWSLAWRTALWARLQDADGVARSVRAALHPVDAPPEALPAAGPDAVAPGEVGGTHRTMLCAHPPFQIDGNFGITAAIAEALVQAHRVGADGVREVHVLPACPWPDGSVAGLRTRGGLTVDVTWAAGEPKRIVLGAVRDAVVDVRWGGRSTRVAVRAGDRATVPVPGATSAEEDVRLP